MGHSPSVNLRWTKEDIITSFTNILDILESKQKIKAIHIPLNVLKKLALG